MVLWNQRGGVIVRIFVWEVQKLVPLKYACLISRFFWEKVVVKKVMLKSCESSKNNFLYM